MTTDRWIKDLSKFFSSIKTRLPVVLDAGGCRENWVQAELYQWFRQREGKENVLVNRLCLDQNERKDDKADLAILGRDKKPILVAEIKVFGQWLYLPKNLDGRGIRYYQKNFAPTAPIVVKKERLWCERNNGGILRDYFRLRDYKPRDRRLTRLLVLVLQRSRSPDGFGKVISRVEFEKDARVLLDRPEVLVKCWPLAVPT
jgi:hypothetical protein